MLFSWHFGKQVTYFVALISSLCLIFFSRFVSLYDLNGWHRFPEVTPLEVLIYSIGFYFILVVWIVQAQESREVWFLEFLVFWSLCSLFTSSEFEIVVFSCNVAADLYCKVWDALHFLQLFGEPYGEEVFCQFRDHESSTYQRSEHAAHV